MPHRVTCSIRASRLGDPPALGGRLPRYWPRSYVHSREAKEKGFSTLYGLMPTGNGCQPLKGRSTRIHHLGLTKRERATRSNGTPFLREFFAHAEHRSLQNRVRAKHCEPAQRAKASRGANGRVPHLQQHHIRRSRKWTGKLAWRGGTDLLQVRRKASRKQLLVQGCDPATQGLIRGRCGNLEDEVPPTSQAAARLERQRLIRRGELSSRSNQQQLQRATHAAPPESNAWTSAGTCAHHLVHAPTQPH